MYSVIIPTLNEGPNLWFTIHSLQQNWNFCSDGQEHELLVVDSGSRDNTLPFLNDPEVSKWATAIATTVSGPGPVRQVGANRAKGDVLFFIDAHVLLPPDFFLLALNAMRLVWDSVGVLHFPQRWNWDGGSATHYQLTLEKNFWGVHTMGGDDRFTEIGVAGHACIAVRADRFRETRGFALPQTKYGGEENYLDMKLARFGYRNYTLGTTFFLHCSQRRQDYDWDYDTLFRNNVMSANAIGGPSWAQKLLDWQLADEHWKPGEDSLRALHREGIEKSEDERQFINAHAKMTLEELLQDWKTRNVPH